MTTASPGPDAPAVHLVDLPHHHAPFENKPRAAKVLQAESAHVVLFAFAAGQVLREHAAHHAVIIQCLSGRVLLTLDGIEPGSLQLRPGDLLHLDPMLRHSVEAIEDSTLTVTMLVSGPGGEGGAVRHQHVEEHLEP